MTLKYPSTAGGIDSDYVTFSPFKWRSNRKGGASPPESSAQAVILYMPNDTPGIRNSNSWSGETFLGPLGNIRKTGGELLGGIAFDAYSSTKEVSISSVTEQLKTAASGVMNNGLGALGQKGMELAGGMMGVTPNQQLALGNEAVFNPNVELFYSSPKLRPFSMSFDFVPKNAAEAQTVNQIIMNFKKWSAPADLENGMFEIPHVWQVKYMTGAAENKNMNRFKTAACVDIQVKANSQPDMHVAHAGGVPIVTSMSLSFMEVDIITRKDHTDVGGQGY
jgi:hypothetical protein